MAKKKAQSKLWGILDGRLLIMSFGVHHGMERLLVETFLSVATAEGICAYDCLFLSWVLFVFYRDYDIFLSSDFAGNEYNPVLLLLRKLFQVLLAAAPTLSTPRFNFISQIFGS